MLIKRRKMWVAPLMLIFGSSESGADKKEKTMFGAKCGESVIRYGPQCRIRIGQECRPRVGTQCHPLRFGPSCAPRIGPNCRPEVPDEPLPPRR